METRLTREEFIAKQAKRRAEKREEFKDSLGCIAFVGLFFATSYLLFLINNIALQLK
jgi:hypothetical protein